MGKYRVLMRDLYFHHNEDKPDATLKRGDWVTVQDGGYLTFRDPSEARKDTQGNDEYLVVCQSRDAIIPHDCLSDNGYDAYENLWIVEDPKQEVQKTVTLMEVADDAQGERAEVPLSKLAKSLGTTQKKLRSRLDGLVISRDGDEWFYPLDNKERHQETVAKLQ